MRSTPFSAKRERGRIADVALDQLDVARQCRGPAAAAMHLVDQAVEHADLVAAAEQVSCKMAADEPGAPGHEYFCHGTPGSDIVDRVSQRAATMMVSLTRP